MKENPPWVTYWITLKSYWNDKKYPYFIIQLSWGIGVVVVFISVVINTIHSPHNNANQITVAQNSAPENKGSLVQTVNDYTIFMSSSTPYKLYLDKSGQLSLNPPVIQDTNSSNNPNTNNCSSMAIVDGASKATITGLTINSVDNCPITFTRNTKTVSVSSSTENLGVPTSSMPHR